MTPRSCQTLIQIVNLENGGELALVSLSGKIANTELRIDLTNS